MSIHDLKGLQDAVDRVYRDTEIPADARGRTRARLLKAATERFQRDGYRKTTIDEIARAAGVAKGTVYTHFTDKADLLFHAIVEEKRRLVGPFMELFAADVAPAERLRRYLELSFLAITEAPLAAKLMRGDHEILLFLQDMPADRRAQLEQNRTALGDVLLKGVGVFHDLPAAERDERTRALQLFIVCAPSLMDERRREGLTREQAARQLARTIAAGLGAP